MEIRHQLPDSSFVFGEKIYGMSPYAFHEFLELLENCNSEPINVNISDRYVITTEQADADDLIKIICFALPRI